MDGAAPPRYNGAIVIFPGKNMCIAATAFTLMSATVPVHADTAPGGEPYRLSQLSWLVGYWVNTDAGELREEVWLAPAGDVMLGMHRDRLKSGKLGYEFMRIESREDGIVYVASPSGQATAEFQLVACEDNQAVFANPEHDFPQRIVYELLDNGSLQAVVSGPVDGTERSIAWTWRKGRL